MKGHRVVASALLSGALVVGMAGTLVVAPATFSNVAAAHEDHDHGDTEDVAKTTTKTEKNKKADENDKKGDHDSGSHSTRGASTHEEHGLIIHDSTGGRAATDKDRARADALYDDVVEGIAKYEDIDVATAAGYRSRDTGLRIRHYFKRGVNGAALDPDQPSGLVYYIDENQATLIGAVWTTTADEPPQPGGPLTVWHDHSAMGCPPEHPECPATRAAGGNPPKMFHVWTFEDAKEPFGHSFVDALGRTRGANGAKARPPFDV